MGPKEMTDLDWAKLLFNKGGISTEKLEEAGYSMRSMSQKSITVVNKETDEEKELRMVDLRTAYAAWQATLPKKTKKPFDKDGRKKKKKNAKKQRRKNR